MAAVKLSWLVDVTNLSNEATTINRPVFEIENERGQTIEVMESLDTRTQDPPVPIRIDPKQTHRFSKDLFFALDVPGKTLLATTRHFSEKKWGIIARAHGVDDLGRTLQAGSYVRVNAVVSSLSGSSFGAAGLWDTSFGPFDLGDPDVNQW